MKKNIFDDFSDCLIIAEIGVNHNGSIDLAKRLIDSAKNSGANAVKFQSFRADKLALRDTPKVDYQKSTTASGETHYQMLKRLELSDDDHYELFNYCKLNDIDFMSTPYDVESASFLMELGVKYFKTASADITDIPLHKYLASTGIPTLVATGMASLGEVEVVVDIYNKANSSDLLLLHCVSNYPCSDESLNLRALKTLSSAFSLPVGLSDHSVGSLAASLSVALNVKVIEKHFTLDKAFDGPDHRASSTPDEFMELVHSVRRAELMLGSERKCCQPEEYQMSQVSRKSLVTNRSILAGEKLAAKDLQLKRPGDGISARFIEKVVGLTVRHNLDKEHKLSWDDLS